MPALSITFNPLNITQLISIRMDGMNYLNWVSQLFQVLRSKDLLAKFVQANSDDDIGTREVNPAFLLWTKKDQFVLNWLNATLAWKILSTTFGLDTSQVVWLALANRYASLPISFLHQLPEVTIIVFISRWKNL
ncbi:hypothetical protein I3843_09G149300 [Carya illinoinensis]|nr:hypothetical protein I3843_09G149300 [Carya illinoinensis]